MPGALLITMRRGAETSGLPNLTFNPRAPRVANFAVQYLNIKRHTRNATHPNTLAKRDIVAGSCPPQFPSNEDHPLLTDRGVGSPGHSDDSGRRGRPLRSPRAA
jgi:hypothetical protein